MNYFKPDFQIDHFSHLTIDFLQRNGIQTIFSDLDSTLTVHNQQGDNQLEQWISSLKQHGITLIIVSNNSQGRVNRFIKPYHISGYGSCKKPFISKITKITIESNSDVHHSLFLGDQLFTDVWCGKRLDMKTALVRPIGEGHEPWNIILKRKVEEWIRSRWS